jgi:TIR domain
LDAHLAGLQHDQVLEPWHSREINAGADWNQEIRQHLDEADVILLLISSDFLNSDYIQSVELRRALERHREGSSIVVPVILRPCDWKTQQFASLQALPTGAKAVTKTRPRDEAWTSVALGIRKIVEARLKPPEHTSVSAPRIQKADTKPVAPPERTSDVNFSDWREQLRGSLNDRQHEATSEEVAALDYISEIASTFIVKPHPERVAAARDVAEMSQALSLVSIAELALSKRGGERVAAGIALREHIRVHREVARDGIVVQLMNVGLRDPHARVRYRFLEALAVEPGLLAHVRDLVNRMSLGDPDPVVRETAADTARKTG